ncbi:hypothetical protein [Amantichitinum ursilacus]|uniref:Lipoprotein n=1 Tax=Amantichitinum ursilacus TaxID=857265 RepID=A0A0N0GLX9_9NEIS|nr:hypothetical protein [Amantichitinum ursilacus]KPC50395.1 hypothetical protein WG78_17345 [Amantichitinum ursilacus]
MKTIQRIVRVSLAAAAALVLSHQASACVALSDGVYVGDEAADARTDGGQWSRVLTELTHADKKFAGTTGQFGLVYVVKNGQISTYHSLPNDLDERYETLYAFEPVKSSLDCAGKFTFEFVIDTFYPPYLRIGQVPKAKGKAMISAVKAQIEGHVLPDGNLFLDTCQAFDERKSGWRKTDDGWGVCGGGSKATLFNIKAKVVGQKGWESIQ